MKLQSAIYTGMIHHRRVSPKVHDFRYPIALFYLDLDELKHFPRIPGVFGYHRRDYLRASPEHELKDAVRAVIQKQTGRESRGPIRLLSQVRYFGFCFNPVSFFYCFDPNGSQLEFIVSEITNTPWNERHVRAFECKPHSPAHFEFQKDFHVSPFLPMDLHYVWDFNTPEPDRADSTLSVHMEDWDQTSNTRIFEAQLSLKPKTLSRGACYQTLVSYPLLTFKAFFSIYIQALKLWIKRVPFHAHPKTRGQS